MGLKVGIIGTGRLGRQHVRVFRRIPEVEFVGCYDIVREKSAMAAREFGAEAFDSMETLLGAVDSVSIVVPTVKHEEMALASLDAGKHVFLEKPVAASVAEAECIVEAAGRAGLVLQIGHVERFNEAIKACRPFVDSPQFIEVHRLAPFTPRGIDVSVIMDLMIHDIDLLNFFLGKLPVDVRAKGAGVLTSAPDIVNARLEYDDGCVANLTASRVSLEPMRKVRIFSRSRYLSIDLYEGKIKHVQKKDTFDRGVEMLRQNKVKLDDVKLQDFLDIDETIIEGEEPLFSELQSFCRSVLDGTTPAVTGEDGLRALRLAAKIQRIVENNQKP